MICELRPDGVMKPVIHVMAQRFNPAFLLKHLGGRCISTKIRHARSGLDVIYVTNSLASNVTARTITMRTLSEFRRTTQDEIPTEVPFKIQVFRDVSQRRLLSSYWRLKGQKCPYLRGQAIQRESPKWPRINLERNAYVPALWHTVGILSTLLALTMEVFVVVLSVSRRIKGQTEARPFSFEVFTYSWSTSHLLRCNEIVSCSNLRNGPILRYCYTIIGKIYFRGLKHASPPPPQFILYGPVIHRSHSTYSGLSGPMPKNFLI
jgi:hypothetical protein